jgi:hypothetical protein
MTESINIALLTVLAVMAFVWFGLCIWTFRRLEKSHPEKYIEIGRPSLVLRNTLESNWSFMKFMWRSDYSVLNDPLLTQICSIMKALLCAYGLLFITMVLSVFYSIPTLK